MARETNETGSPPGSHARLPRFSPTRIALYVFCPRAYRAYYREGLKWGRMNAGHAFGGSLHRVLQLFHAQGGAEHVTVEELQESLRQRWTHAGYGSDEEAEAHLERGIRMLAEHHARSAAPERETLWTERTVQHRYPDFVLFGKIDRLDRRPDGSLEVVDYKSGRWTVTEHEVREDLALSVYQLLVARENPGTPVYAGILCLCSGEGAAVVRTEAELDAFEVFVVDLVRRIMSDERMEAVPGAQCRNCLYPRVCPPGRRWLAAHPLLAPPES